MKIKNKAFYKRLYVSNSWEDATDEQMNHFVICGDRNWEYFYEKVIDDKKDFNEVKNVKLIEFFSQNDLKKYLKKLPDTKLLDFSVEKDFKAVLELAS